MDTTMLCVRRVLCVIALVFLTSCAAPSVSQGDAMRMLNSGNYAMIYGGAYQVDTGLITSSRTVTPGTIKLSNQSRDIPSADRFRTIDSATNRSAWGSAIVPAGTWRVSEIVTLSAGLMSSAAVTSSVPLPDDATITVKPGDVVYIGQFEAAAPSVSTMLSTRKITRRDNFEAFRSELHDTNPDLASRVIYRPLRSTAIVDAR